MASGGGTSNSSSAALKILGCGFIMPWSEDETVAVMSPSSSKWVWNDARQRCEFETRPMRTPAVVRVFSTAGTSS